MKRVALYARVSHEEQAKHGLSIDNQIDSLTQYANEHKYKIVDTYVDAGISARKSYSKRPALLRLLSDCQQGKIDLICFTRLDRWFRSIADYYDVQRILDDCKVPWNAIWEDYNLETSEGIFKTNILLAIAQSEADRTSEKIKSVFEYKLSQGEYVGGSKAPLGYRRNGKQYEINPAEYEAIRAFFDTYLSTLSLTKAMLSAEAKGLTMSTPQARRVLYHDAHAGLLPYCPEAYITKEQHELICKAKYSPTKNYQTGYKYIFSGLLVCKECRCHLVAHRTKNPRRQDGVITHTIRYVCRNHENRLGCSGASIGENILEQYLIDNLDGILNEYTIEIEAKKKQIDYQSIIDKNTKKLKRLADLYELGDIELSEYKTKRDAIKEEISNLERAIDYKEVSLSTDWKSLYHSLDREHKRAFWMETLNYIEINGLSCKIPKVFF